MYPIKIAKHNDDQRNCKDTGIIWLRMSSYETSFDDAKKKKTQQSNLFRAIFKPANHIAMLCGIGVAICGKHRLVHHVTVRHKFIAFCCLNAHCEQ